MFIRRFNSEPTLAEIQKVTGVVLVDQPPPGKALVPTFGKVCIVGEFEDGAFNVPTDLIRDADYVTKFGSFGYTYGTNKNRYACAVRSGGSEDWNGNAWIQGTRYPWKGGRCIVRVDTSIGEVSLTPRAFVQSAVKPNFVITPGLTFIFNPNGAGNVTATFAGTAGARTGVAGTFPTLFAGGEVLPFSINGGPTVTVTFSAAAQSLLQVIAEINAVTGVTTASQSGGQLRLSSLTFGTGSSVQVLAGTALATLGLTVGTTTGTGDAADLATMTFAEWQTKVQAASALVIGTLSSTGYPRLVSKLGGTGTLVIGAGTANAALGFTSATSVTAALPADTTIPAGSRCTDGGADASRVVTMQTNIALAGSVATVNIPVRPAVDDGTYLGVIAAAIDQCDDQPGGYEWACTNIAALTAALSAATLDARYLAAIATTVGVSSLSKRRINGIVSARQSNAIRPDLGTNAGTAASNGHRGRVAFVCPPLDTTAEIMLGSSAPGVPLSRSERSVYCGGSVASTLTELVTGGYSTTGEIERHADMFLASRWGSLPAGFDPGQVPESDDLRLDESVFSGLGTEAATWDMDTYAVLAAAGIAAAFFGDFGLQVEQSVTSVDKALDPDRTELSRLTLSDFIGDGCAEIAIPQIKRQTTAQRTDGLEDRFEALLESLTEAKAGQNATVKASSISRTEIATGLTQFSILVEPVGAMKNIIINLGVGPNSLTVTAALGQDNKHHGIL